MSIWLQIAAIIATLISPLLAVWLQVKLSRATATPDINQPKNLSQSKGGRFKNHLKVYWPLYFGISLSISGLIYSFYKAEPLDRWRVLFITLFSAALVLNIMSIISIRTLNLVNKHLDKHLDKSHNLMNRMSDIIKEQSSLIDSIADTIRTSLTNTSDKPPETTTNKLRTMLKKLLGD